MTDDKYTRAWWDQQFTGVCHALNECKAKDLEQEKRIKAAHDRIDELVSLSQEKDAVIGQLIERLDKASSLYAELRAEVRNGHASQTRKD